jgi:hypothetical protein
VRKLIDIVLCQMPMDAILTDEELTPIEGLEELLQPVVRNSLDVAVALIARCRGQLLYLMGSGQ